MIRMYLREIAGNTRMCDRDLRQFAACLAGIIRHWQIRAGERDVTDYAIEFYEGPTTATLLQVFALLPQEYQGHIYLDRLENTDRFEGYDGSWLSENVMDVLVQLSHTQGQPVRFGRGLASFTNSSLDAYSQAEHDVPYLDLLVTKSQPDSGWNESDWNDKNILTHPLSTKTLVYFWNYDATHWTLVATEIDKEAWTHTLYNSMCSGMRGSSWKSAMESIPQIQGLLRAASGFPEPLQGSFLCFGKCYQQDNKNDCGVIATYNAIELLNGREPELDINPKRIRLRFLELILSALKSQSSIRDEGTLSSGDHSMTSGASPQEVEIESDHEGRPLCLYH